MLTLRAEVRAYLWAAGEMEMPEAVDELESYAFRSGLLQEIGQDAVQAIISAAFEPYQQEVAYA